MPIEPRPRNHDDYNTCAKRFAALCDEKGMSLPDLAGPSRRADLVDQRTEIAKILRGEEYTVEQIAYAMNRDHTTVCLWLDDKNRARKNKRALKRYKIYKKEKKNG